jgi:IS5 family transposase
MNPYDSGYFAHLIAQNGADEKAKDELTAARACVKGLKMAQEKG